MIYKTNIIDDTYEVNLKSYTKENLMDFTILQIKKLINEGKITVRKLSNEEVIQSYQCYCS